MGNLCSNETGLQVKFRSVAIWVLFLVFLICLLHLIFDDLVSYAVASQFRQLLLENGQVLGFKEFLQLHIIISYS